MNPVEALEAELKELKRKRSSAYKTIDMCNDRIEVLEEAIEHLRILPRYQESEDDNE